MTTKKKYIKIKQDKKRSIQSKLNNVTIVEGLIVTLDVMNYSSALCVGIMAMALSHKPSFISSLLVSDATSWIEYLGFGLFHFGLLVSSIGGILFVVLYLTIYMITSCHWMRHVTAEIKMDKGQVSDLFVHILF